MTAKEPQGTQTLRDQFATRVLMTVHHSGPCTALLLCVLKKGIKRCTDGQAGAQQSLHVTLEVKILYVMPGKIGRGGPPLLLKNRKRLCFPDVWLGAALWHGLGRLLPAKGVFCPAPCAQRDTEEVTGSSASLEGLHRLIPLNALGAPRLGRLYAQIKPKRFPPRTAACLPGVLLPAALCCFFAEPSAAGSCFQTFPSSSHPTWLLSSKYQGQNTPLLVPQGCPRVCLGDATAHLYHPVKCPLAAGRKDRRRLV